MINDKVNKQEGGENSTNLQGQSIVINQGISYKDAKEIALDVFKANYLQLSEKAASKAKERAEELVDDFLSKMGERQPNAINEMENPGMQYAIFTAQKEYAKTGDKNLSDILVDILVDRAAQPERNLLQIVLDESLSIVPKLTKNQLDTLTIIYLVLYTSNNSVHNLDAFKNYLSTHIVPFIPSLSSEASLYQHIAFTSCGSIDFGNRFLEVIFLGNYPHLFCKGFTQEEFELKTGKKFVDFPFLITSCYNDAAKFQIATSNRKILEATIRALKLDENTLDILTPFIDNYQLEQHQVKEIIIQQNNQMGILFDIWDNSQLNAMNLTSVGITIGATNLRQKTGIQVDLGIWIK